MELNVGDYCRTLKGIVKIAKIEDGVMTDTKGYLHYGDFIKSAEGTPEGLLSLIEVGDYVNGLPVLHKENNELVCDLFLRYKEEDIQNVVTKEQFKDCMYKVGE